MIAASLMALATGGVSPDPPAQGSAAPPTEFEWDLPRGFPPPKVPAGNPMSAAKVDLGRRLFYERRLSLTGEHSCASCHRQELAFTDGRARGVGATGEHHSKSSMSLANVAYNPVFGWSDPRPRGLEGQALDPLLGDHPLELGLAGRVDQVVADLESDGAYRVRFEQAFPHREEPISLESITQALAAFQRTIFSGRSSFDRWLSGEDPTALSASARRGARLFFSSRTGCSRCHRGFNLSGPAVWEGAEPTPPLFHNTGLYDLDGHGAYPADSPGLMRHTGDPTDMGRFRAPTLRNVELTAPYMHDGAIATLEKVVEHYVVGGRSGSPLTSSTLRPLKLDAGERDDLVAFLLSLTDPCLVSDPRLSDPLIDPLAVPAYSPPIEISSTSKTSAAPPGMPGRPCAP